MLKIKCKASDLSNQLAQSIDHLRVHEQLDVVASKTENMLLECGIVRYTLTAKGWGR